MNGCSVGYLVFGLIAISIVQLMIYFDLSQKLKVIDKDLAMMKATVFLTYQSVNGDKK